MIEYSTTDAANLFNKSRETVRKWAMTFARFMSPTANPAKGRDRRFNEDDIRVLALVHQQKVLGQTYDEIAAMLHNGMRADPPAGASALSRDTVEQQLAATLQQIKELEHRLHQNEIDIAVANRERDIYRQQLEEARRRIDELNQEIGRLKK